MIYKGLPGSHVRIYNSAEIKKNFVKKSPQKYFMYPVKSVFISKNRENVACIYAEDKDKYIVSRSMCTIDKQSSTNLNWELKRHYQRLLFTSLIQFRL